MLFFKNFLILKNNFFINVNFILVVSNCKNNDHWSKIRQAFVQYGHPVQTTELYYVQKDF